MRPLTGTSITFHTRGDNNNARTAVHLFVLARSNTSAIPDQHRGRQQLRRRGPACRALRAGERDLRGHNRRVLLRPAPAVRAAALARRPAPGEFDPGTRARIEHIVVGAMENRSFGHLLGYLQSNQVMRL